MNKKSKALICMLMVCAIFLASASPMAVYATSGNIGIVINGKTLTLDQPPIVESGRTLVPLRAIFEELGAQVQWDGATQTITGTKGNSEIKLVVGSTVATVDGREVKLDVPAKVYNGRTLVPTRFVAESLGANVDWDGGKRVVNITAKLAAIVDEAAITEYIEVFETTIDLFVENLLSFSYAMIMTGGGDFELVQDMTRELQIENDEYTATFNSQANVGAFAQSQLYMKRVLNSYNLVLSESVIMIDLAINDEGNITELLKISESITKNLESIDTDLQLAIEYFQEELKAYEN